jgi:cobalt/nickel transport system permease protein
VASTVPGPERPRAAPRAGAGRDRRILLGGLVALFALSALADPRWLAAAWLAALLLFRRGAARALRRLLVAVVPVSLGFSLASAAWAAWPAGRPVDWPALGALNLRTTLLAFLTFSALARVNPMRAVAPWPAAARLLAITLGQIHALRMLVRDSALGLRSRMVRRPGAVDVVRGAGAVTGTLFTLSARNARDVADALRARGA